MDKNQVIDIFNKENTFFLIDKNETNEYKINYLTDNQLINEIVDNFLRDILLDNICVNKKNSFDKYINMYSKFYKLSESISSFDFSPNEDSMSFKAVDYLQFVMDRLSEILKRSANHENHKSEIIDAEIIDDLGVNRCLGCGIDMGDCNPRQYCRKTYCPNETFVQDFLDQGTQMDM